MERVNEIWDGNEVVEKSEKWEEDLSGCILEVGAE